MLLFYVPLFMLRKHIPATDVQDKSSYRDNRVDFKSCKITKYKKGHISFVWLHMKSVETGTVKRLFSDMKHFDQVPNELLLTWL